MLKFIRRIPELLGLKRIPAPGAGREDARIEVVKNTPRGRGTGRGLNPKSSAKPKGNRQQRRSKG